MDRASEVSRGFSFNSARGFRRRAFFLNPGKSRARGDASLEGESASAETAENMSLRDEKRYRTRNARVREFNSEESFEA